MNGSLRHLAFSHGRKAARLTVVALVLFFGTRRGAAEELLSRQNAPLRGARLSDVSAGATLRLGTRPTASPSMERVEAGESQWQEPYPEAVERLKFEHTFGGNLYVRIIDQNAAHEAGGKRVTPTPNMLLTWPPAETTDLYFVANGSRTEGVREIMKQDDTRSVALKVSHALSF